LDDHYKHPRDDKKIKFRINLLGSNRENVIWIILITVISFFISAFMAFTSTKILEDVNNVVAFCVVFIIIIIGIIFDMIGTAVTAADETPFHAMASRKVYGSMQALWLIRNANKVASICNDVVGDIAGVISGTASAFIVVRISNNTSLAETALTGLIVSGLVASVTIGGKATGKTAAIHNSNFMVYKVAIVIKFFTSRINIFDNVNLKRKK